MSCDRSRLLACAIGAALLVAGCAHWPRQPLPAAPTADAPYQERAAYFKQFAPEAADFTQNGYLLLHDGSRLYWPEDLLPAVAPDSPTARAVAEHVQARDTSNTITTWLLLPSYTGTLIGCVALAVGFSFSSGDMLGRLVSPLTLAPAGFLGLALVGVLVGNMLNADPARLANESLLAIVTTYPQSLEDRLQVHVNADGNIVDTSAAAGSQPATSVNRNALKD